MGIRTTIYLPSDQISRSIQYMAKLNSRSVSNYLIWLHDRFLSEMGMTYEEIKKPLIVNIEEPTPVEARDLLDIPDNQKVVPVHRENEESDRDFKHLDRTHLDTVREKLDAIEKKNSPPEPQDWRITKTSYSKGDSVDPGGTGQKAKMK